MAGGQLIALAAALNLSIIHHREYRHLWQQNETGLQSALIERLESVSSLVKRLALYEKEAYRREVRRQENQRWQKRLTQSGEILPEQVWLSRLTVTDGQAIAEGFASDSATLERFQRENWLGSGFNQPEPGVVTRHREGQLVFSLRWQKENRDATSR